jgi:hypothetical protein
MPLRLSSLLAFFVLLLSAPAVMALDYDDVLDGDFSDLPDAPTPIVLDLGPNEVAGTLDGLLDVRDYVTFTLDPGLALAEIRLLQYTNAELEFIPGNRGFHAIIDGDTSFIPDVDTASLFLGGDHLDPLPVDTDLLPLLAAAPLAGVGFDIPLESGTYTYHVQNTSPDFTRYRLEFVVVPEPSTALLMGFGLMSFTAIARRRAPRPAKRS